MFFFYLALMKAIWRLKLFWLVPNDPPNMGQVHGHVLLLLLFVYFYKWMWSVSCVWLFVSPWTVAHQAPLPMEFSRQEYWGGVPFLTPGDLPNPGVESASLASPALAGGFFTTSNPREPQMGYITQIRIWLYSENSLKRNMLIIQSTYKNEFLSLIC